MPTYARASSSPIAVLLLGGWSSCVRITLSDREAGRRAGTRTAVFGTNTRPESSTRPSFSTALRQRFPWCSPGALATLGKPLIREFLFYPEPASLEAGGQWPVCCAGASPTEVRCALQLQSHIQVIVDPSRGVVNRKLLPFPKELMIVCYSLPRYRYSLPEYTAQRLRGTDGAT